MPSLNTILLLAISDLSRRPADAVVTVKSRDDGATRGLHVSRSSLVATESSVIGERLGNMLAGEGRLDPVLLEPVANEARKRGTLLGSQLVTDGLLSPTELASALERQARLRFENALASTGTVAIVPKSNVHPVIRIPLAAALAVAFRARINLKDIQALIAERPRLPLPLDLNGEVFNRLELGPGELRTCRAIAARQTLEQVLAGSTAPDSVTRSIGVLVALGLWA